MGRRGGTCDERPPNTFTGAALDRAGERRRDDEWLADQRAHPHARAVVASAAASASPAATTRGSRSSRSSRRAPASRCCSASTTLGPVFATEADGAPVELLGLREAAASLPQSDSGLAAYAAALLGWHRTPPLLRQLRRRHRGRRGRPRAPLPGVRRASTIRARTRS